MNRLLLASAATLSMAVSSHAMAASYVIDTVDDGTEFNAEMGLIQSQGETGDYDRTASFVSTQPPSYAFFGELDGGETAIQINNDSAANGTLTLNYNISSLAAGLGSIGNSALTFTIFGTEGNGRASIQALVNGNSLGTWVSSQAAYYEFSNTWQTGSFSFANSALTGTDDTLQLIFSGDTGYDLTVGALTIGNVSPVPEASEWAMLVAGLGVVGAVARRRRIGATA